MKRHLRINALWLSVGALLFVAAVFLFPEKCDPPRFTFDQYNSIQPGMTLDQVEAILGCKSGDYVPKDYWRSKSLMHGTTHHSGFRPENDEHSEYLLAWSGLSADAYPYSGAPILDIRLWFDSHGKVSRKDWSEDRVHRGYSLVTFYAIDDSIAGKVEAWFRELRQ
jgi:hypothetical protein